MMHEAALPPNFFSTLAKMYHVLYEFCIVLQCEGEKEEKGELYKRSAFVLIPFVFFTILYVCMLQFTK